MRKHTDSSKNSVLLPHLQVLARCYSTGCFETLFPRMSEDVVMESQWVLQPNVGRAVVEDYFVHKGQAMRQGNCCPACEIVQLIGNLQKVECEALHINGQPPVRASFGLWYPDGKLCLYMSQNLNGEEHGVIVDLTLNEDDNICRIDVCMPQLFRFEKYTSGV